MGPAEHRMRWSIRGAFALVSRAPTRDRGAGVRAKRDTAVRQVASRSAFGGNRCESSRSTRPWASAHKARATCSSPPTAVTSGATAVSSTPAEMRSRARGTGSPPRRDVGPTGAEEDRRAHLNGAIPAALGQVGPELLAADPEIRPTDMIAVKYPRRSPSALRPPCGTVTVTDVVPSYDSSPGRPSSRVHARQPGSGCSSRLRAGELLRVLVGGQRPVPKQPVSGDAVTWLAG
jgi:hypothetical protein